MSLIPRPVDFKSSALAFCRSLDALYQFRGDPVAGIDMVTRVYALCTAHPRPYVEPLFITIADYLTHHVHGILASLMAAPDVLGAYADAWERYRTASTYANHVCAYLNALIVDGTSHPGYAAAAQYGRGYGSDGGAGAGAGGTRTAHKAELRDGYKRQCVASLAFTIWKRDILHAMADGRLGLMQAAFRALERDRDGCADAQTGAAHVLVQSLVEVNVYADRPLALYVEFFETPFLAQTKVYYTRESTTALMSLSMSGFMQKACRRLAEEIPRCQQFCHPTSHAALELATRSAYVGIHRQKLHDAFGGMLESEAYDECVMVYVLLAWLPESLNALLETFRQHVTRRGLAILAGLGDDGMKQHREYVLQLGALHATSMTVSRDVFDNDPLFLAAVDKALGHVVNLHDPLAQASASAATAMGGSDLTTTASTSATATASTAAALASSLKSGPSSRVSGAEILAKFCDVLLKKSPKSAHTGVDDVEAQLRTVVGLFKYVESKDLFQKCYARALSRRLIFDQSVSEDAEISMVSKLCTECGTEYTAKFQRMFTDLAISRDLTSAFGALDDAAVAQLVAQRPPAAAARGPRDPADATNPPTRLASTMPASASASASASPSLSRRDFRVLVLTSGSWPLGSAGDASDAGAGGSAALRLPPALGRTLTAFTAFYDARYTGRKLMWKHHLGRGEVRTGGWYRRAYDLTLSLPQLALVVAFNPDAGAVALPTRGTGIRSSGDLVAITGLGARDIARAMAPLVELGLFSGQTDAATAAEAGGHDDDGDDGDDAVTWQVNPKFAFKKIKIKVPAALAASAAAGGKPRRLGAARPTAPKPASSPRDGLGNPEGGVGRDEEATAVGTSLSPPPSPPPPSSAARPRAGRAAPVASSATVQDEADADAARLRQTVAADRSFALQAALVRIMKARGRMDHRSLTTQVVAQVAPRFVPTPMVVKHAIEVLLEKGFLGRDPDHRDVYHYVS